MAWSTCTYLLENLCNLFIYKYSHSERFFSRPRKIPVRSLGVCCIKSALDYVLKQNWCLLFWRKEMELLMTRYWFERGGKLKDNQYSVSTVKSKWILKWCLFEFFCFTQPLISETADQMITAQQRCSVKCITYSFLMCQYTRSVFAQIYTNPASPNKFSAITHTRQCHRWLYFPFHEKIHRVKGMAESSVEQGNVFPLTAVNLEPSLT